MKMELYRNGLSFQNGVVVEARYELWRIIEGEDNLKDSTPYFTWTSFGPYSSSRIGSNINGLEQRNTKVDNPNNTRAALNAGVFNLAIDMRVA